MQSSATGRSGPSFGGPESYRGAVDRGGNADLYKQFGEAQAVPGGDKIKEQVEKRRQELLAKFSQVPVSPSVGGVQPNVAAGGVMSSAAQGINLALHQMGLLPQAASAINSNPFGLPMGIIPTTDLTGHSPYKTLPFKK